MTKKRGRPKGRKKLPDTLTLAAKVLHDQGKSENEIAKELEINRAHVHRALMQRKAVPSIEDMEKVKTGQAEKMVQILSKLLDKALLDESVAKIAPVQLFSPIGILTEKIQLLTGKPTQITEHKDVVEAAKMKLADIERQERELIKSLGYDPFEEKEDGNRLQKS